MKQFIKGALLTGLCVFAVTGHARVYQHVDPFTGAVTYSNLPPRGQAVEEEPARLPESTAAATPAPEQTAPKPVPKKAAAGTAPVPARAAASPADFPKVAAAVQRARDTDRKKILLEEMQLEQSAFTEAIARKASEEVLNRHRANISALQREINNVK